eukprot:CAMPEP_0206448940 /NCGR_PEP_ID=MMETSP0324_2-20121206/17793_1 /ASSEMBLY_ACC=CAM_ASM_000836 /TAXON_ID=2866 /ORGANISM="Crypthecodinium cohnii, Strain Seligo" /LENGTH=641 /DNA_ID=CAMNT_0053918223 /DNA_START=81 /DNA_END=2006 /DNA_ORIENTATION=+
MAFMEDEDEGDDKLPEVKVAQKPPSAGGKVVAVGAVDDREATFVVFVAGLGIKYLNIADDLASTWTSAGGFSGSAASGKFGLYYHHDGSGPHAFVSFVDNPAKGWVCLKVPAVGESMSVEEAEVVETTSFGNSEVLAACRTTPGVSGLGAVVLTAGALRFLDLTNGTVVGKAAKILDKQQMSAGGAGMHWAIAGASERRVVVAHEAEYFIFEQDEGETSKIMLKSQGQFGLSGLGPVGSLAGAYALPVEDRVLLCWNGATPEAERVYGTAELNSGPAASSPSSSSSSFSIVSRIGIAANADETSDNHVRAEASSAKDWMVVGDYLVTCLPPVAGKVAPRISIVDARFGMSIACQALPLKATTAAVQFLVASKGGAVVVDTNGGCAPLRWTLPKFSLGLLVGARRNKVPLAVKGLVEVCEVLNGKRERHDADVQDALSGKRQKVTDDTMATLIAKRSWEPSHELVDLISDGKCWESAKRLLDLPDLGEDLSTRLLAASGEEASILCKVVKRASTPSLLQAALSDYIQPAALPALVEVLVDWMEAYRDFGNDAVQRAAPELPTQAEIVRFLSALADGCLTSLLRLEGDLLERVAEVLMTADQDRRSQETLYSTMFGLAKTREVLADIKLPQQVPAVEVKLVDF